MSATQSSLVALQNHEPPAAAPVLQVAVDALTPEMVARLASLAARLGALADELARGGQAWAVPALRALEAAADQAAARQEVPTWRELLRLARQPSTRRGLWFLLATAAELGRQLERGGLGPA